ncbi:MAG: hypothetical protein Q8R78_00705 [Candidatus Omnitrophota bacterium]|nr:hypothetical protein [Candidatus Omnitrophota bacterium]
MAEPTRYQSFREEMEAAGYEVQEYRGRNYYNGPAVTISRDQLQDIIRATTVRLQSDALGKGLIVYPA